MHNPLLFFSLCTIHCYFFFLCTSIIIFFFLAHNPFLFFSLCTIHSYFFPCAQSHYYFFPCAQSIIIFFLVHNPLLFFFLVHHPLLFFFLEHNGAFFFFFFFFFFFKFGYIIWTLGTIRQAAQLNSFSKKLILCTIEPLQACLSCLYLVDTVGNNKTHCTTKLDFLLVSNY